ncbi:MAG: molybdopterin-synthase adenylyltransferase MoeB, partial [Chloroflexota bacterium]
MTSLPPLSRDEISRYSRQLLLPEISMIGQQKLKAASVLIVGVGGLGSPIALYLAAAGVGRIGLVDADTVDISNLQRQIIHTTSSSGTLKVDSAKQRMLEINPLIQVDLFPVRFDHTNARQISDGYDILVDGTDNIPSRYLLNDLAVLTNRPYVYGSVYRFEGQVSVFGLPEGPCYRCLFPDPPPPGAIPSCSVAGVLGVLPGLVGTLQATEVIKLITGAGKTLLGKLMLLDTMDMSVETVNVRKRMDCPLCGNSPVIHELIDYDTWCGIGPDADMGSAGEGLDLEPEQVHQAQQAGKPYLLLDVRELFEINLANIPNTLAIPMGEIDNRLAEIPKDIPVVIF